MDNKHDKVLEAARQLAAEIATSGACRDRDLALANIEKDADKMARLHEYKRLSRALQINRLKGITPTFDEEASLSLLYSRLCVTPDCKAYLDASAQIDDMLLGVYEILNSSIKYP